jgi:RHS repeat-associated protein
VSVDSSGSLVARHAFDPWGRRTVVSGTSAAERGFAGQYWHEQVGLSLTQFRTYDTELGRWISQDPPGMVDGPNEYA